MIFLLCTLKEETPKIMNQNLIDFFHGGNLVVSEQVHFQNIH